MSRFTPSLDSSSWKEKVVVLTGIEDLQQMIVSMEM
jgi:hypothetical protein